MPNQFDKIEETDAQGNLKAGYQVEDSGEPDSTTADSEIVEGTRTDIAPEADVNINNPVVGDSIYDLPEAAQ